MRYDPALNNGQPTPLHALLLEGQVFAERIVGMAQPIGITQQPFVERDGVLINSDTGEIVGVADPFGDWGFLPDDEPTRFAVNSMATLEWVMERFQNRELAIQTMTRRRELLVKNLDAMIADENRDLERLHARFDAEIHAFAKEQLDRQGRS